MQLLPKTALALLGLLLSAPAWAQGTQRTIQYDGVVVDANAAITCGFCSGEKYGSIFYALGAGSLQPADFPLSLDSILLPIAPTQVTFNGAGFVCEPRAQSGMVGITLEVYAGQTVPNQIGTLPTGAWPGEDVIVGPSSTMLEYSVENPVGSGSWELRFNTITVGAQVQAPNTYIRVVVDIGTGGSSYACQILGYQPPDISPFRDNNGRAGARRHFIRELANSLGGTPEGWKWIEDIQDINGNTIDGDWVIRLNVTPDATPPPVDAGVPDDAAVELDASVAPDATVNEDAGPAPADAALPADSGVVADAGFDPDSGPPADSGVVPDRLTINGISPSQGFNVSSTEVTVVGSGFQAGLTLKVGSEFAAVRSLSGSSTLEATIPPNLPLGAHDVIVTNPGGEAAILAAAFRVNPPVGDQVVAENTGCGCSTGGPEGGLAGPGLALGLLALAWRRRR